MDNEKNVLSPEELENAAGGYDEYGGYIRHTVVRGDTLSGLAQRYRTSIDAIMRLNPIITNRDLIKVGWVLLIPDNR